MNQKTFLFYDIETTGLNPCFDQILQFAAIRTDTEFKELERIELRIKLNRDIVPSPAAMITHGLSFKDFQSGLNEYDAVRQIHQLVNTPGTISVGYNTLGFDDEFLRFSFFRNLLPPYTHQYANQCGRMDIYPLTILFYLFHPKALQWPQINNSLSLKLEHLNAANQFVTGKSHHAMVDVEATAALARQLMQANGTKLLYFSGFFNKKIDIDRFEKITPCFQMNNKSHREALMINSRFGTANHFQSPTIYLGNHEIYNNQSVWLRLDNPHLNQTALDTIPQTTASIRKKWGEQEIILPLEDQFLFHLDEQRKKLVRDNKIWLQEHPRIFKDICEYHCRFEYVNYPDRDIQSSLYDIGFPSDTDLLMMKRFHENDFDNKLKTLNQFSKPIYRELAKRLLARHYPQILNDNDVSEFQNYLKITYQHQSETKLIDFRGKEKLTSQQALLDIQELRFGGECNNHQLQCLDELENYLLSDS